jgi:pyridoxine/pyridoxamine 5'-phosphate oxidase
MKKFMMAFVLAFAMVFSTFAGVNAAGSKTASLVLKKASKSGVVLSSKIVSKKGVAAKYNKMSVVSVAKALKGQKVVKAKGVKLSKLKKLSKMVRIYRKKKKSSKNTKVTLKVPNLSKKVKKVYALHYNAKAKKWYITKLTINRKNKTVTGKWNRLGTTALVYTA